MSSSPSSLSYAFISGSAVRAEVCAYVHPLGVVSLGQPRNHSSRFAADHAESWPSAFSQVAIQRGQGSDQPFPTSLSGGFQQCRVENEEW